MQGRRRRRPLGGVADAEAAVAVLALRALPDDVADDPEHGMELGAPGPLDAVHGPDPTVLLEVRGRWRVPVLRVNDRRASALRRVDLLVHGRDRFLGAGDREGAFR